MASLTTAETTSVAKTKYQPSEFLKSVLGRPVIVKLNSGVDYRGVKHLMSAVNWLLFTVLDSLRPAHD